MKAYPLEAKQQIHLKDNKNKILIWHWFILCFLPYDQYVLYSSTKKI